MSAATDRTATFEVGAVAHVNFRVRCESLGHGEEVYLVAEGDKGRTKVGVVSLLDRMSITGLRVRTKSRGLPREDFYAILFMWACDPSLCFCWCLISTIDNMILFIPRHSRLPAERGRADSSGPGV
jgi:hypothetical protein